MSRTARQRRPWRLAAAIAALHVMTVGIAYLFLRPPAAEQTPAPTGMRASLVELPAAAQARPAQPRPAPARATENADTPTESPARATENADTPTESPARPERQGWRARTAAEIRADAAPTRTHERRPDRARVDGNALRRHLQQSLAAVPAAATVSGRLPQDYSNRLLQWLYSRWQPPTRSQAGHDGMRAVVTLTIAADGRITAGRLVRASGNRAFDQSVRALLQQLDQAPPLPTSHNQAPATVRVTLVLDDTGQ